MKVSKEFNFRMKVIDAIFKAREEFEIETEHIPRILKEISKDIGDTIQVYKRKGKCEFCK